MTPTFLIAFGGTLIFFVLLWALFAQFLPRQPEKQERERTYRDWQWPER